MFLSSRKFVSRTIVEDTRPHALPVSANDEGRVSIDASKVDQLLRDLSLDDEPELALHQTIEEFFARQAYLSRRDFRQ